MKRNTFTAIVGSVLILAGVVFLLDNLGLINAEYIFRDFWPLFLILGGIGLLSRGRRSHGSDAGPGATSSGLPAERGASVTEDRTHASAVFGKIERKVSSRNFSGGECSIVFGDIILDLTDAELASGEQILRTSAVFGSVVIDLPSGVEYSVKTNHVAGGMDVNGARKGGMFQSLSFRSKGYETAVKRLSISVSFVFGDVKIRQRL